MLLARREWKKYFVRTCYWYGACDMRGIKERM